MASILVLLLLFTLSEQGDADALLRRVLAFYRDHRDLVKLLLAEGTTPLSAGDVPPENKTDRPEQDDPMTVLEDYLRRVR